MVTVSSAATVTRIAALALVPMLLVGCSTGANESGAQSPVASEAASSAAPQTATTEPVEVAEAAPATATPANAAVQTQLDYVLAYWSDYNDDYGVVTGTDCVNFTSQSLVARGWNQTSEWYYGESSVWDSSPTWVSSTAMNEYFSTRSDLVALDDTQRDQVALGDVVQFDWDNSGDRDHTGVVTRIEYLDGETKIYFAGHTTDSDFRSVDDAITIDHPGGSVYYWHLPV